MKILQETETYFEPYFLGKWNLDKDFPRIPASKLHMPPTLRSHTRKKPAENCGIANLSATSGKLSRRAIVSLQRLDIIFKIVTPEKITFKVVTPEKQKENRGRGRKKKVNEFQGIETQAGENSKDLSSTEIQRGKGQMTHNKENDEELCKHVKRKAAQDARVFLREITNQITKKQQIKKHFNENKPISKEDDLIQVEKNEQEKSKRRRFKEDNPTRNEQKLSKRRRSKEENPIQNENENSKRQRCKKGIPTLNEIEKSNIRVSKEEHPKQYEQELSKRTRSKDGTLTRNEQGKQKPRGIETRIDIIKQKKNKKSQQVCGEEIEGGQGKTDKAIRKRRDCIKAEKDTSVQKKRVSAMKGKKILIIDSDGDDDGDITWVKSNDEDHDATWVVSDYYNNETAWGKKGGKTHRKNKGVKSNNETQKVAGKNITASKGKDNESAKKQGSKIGSNLSLNKQEKSKAERGKATKAPQKDKKTDKTKKKVEENCKEPLKPKDVEVSAKRGTLKYLLQREEYVKAMSEEIEVEEDFFADEIFKKKKNDLGKYLGSSSHDDSLIIKTPINKGKNIPNNIITPRTEFLGRFGAVTPSTTPYTSSPTSITKPEHRKAALEVMFHQMQGGKKGRPRGIRKALHDSMQFANSAVAKPNNLPLLELPQFSDAAADNENDTSIDDYFNTSDAL